MYNLAPLHYGNIEMVEALLDHKADMFAKDQEGQFLIHQAALLDHDKVVDALLTVMEQAKYVCPGRDI